MTERNIANATIATLAVPFVDFFYPLRYFLILAAVLIVADLRWGVQKAHARRQEVRRSRAVRRTMNKVMDYLCWITIAGLFGKSFGEVFGVPILPFLMLLVIYGIEANSCFSNYFAAHGIRKRINIFTLFRRGGADIIEPDDQEDQSTKP